MNNREKRKGIAEETLSIIEKGFFVSNNGVRIDIDQVQELAELDTVVYRPSDSNKLLKMDFEELGNPTEIVVNDLTTLDATRALIDEGYKDVLCLNFASAKNPGGGFLGGSQAQEESIARSTGLYSCQLMASEYYQVNRKERSCMYTDYMIYSPGVPIFKDEEGQNLEELIQCGIITAPAVNFGVVRTREPERIEEVEEVMKRRIRKVLAIALENGHQTIVLGAWGCGVFQNDPAVIADYFKTIIEGDFKNRFNKIVFAIYSNNPKFIKPFKELFD